MTPSLDRRLFLKTFLAAAACPAHAFGAAPGPATAAPDDPASVLLTHSNQQLRVAGTGAPAGFQNYLQVAGQWKPATLPSHLVTGPSFPLNTSGATLDGKTVRLRGTASATGLDGKPLPYEWTSEIEALPSSFGEPWVRFTTALHLPAPLRLQSAGGAEPQLIVWLSSTSTLMEGQSGSWRRVVLDQPTRNSLGTAGNDLPGLYLLDQTLGVETLMFFDMDDMGWMSIENLPRFLVYRCGALSKIGRDGTQRLGVGLLATQATGDILPAGTIRFTSYLLQRPETRLITGQEAVTRWMAALLPLFREKLGWPACATSWEQFAAGTVGDLVDDTSSQVTVNGHTGLRAYAKATSRIWTQPDNNFELMTLADVLWPSLLYLRLHPSPAFEALCNRLAASLPGFYHPDTHSISNDYIRSPHERADSWYPFENALIKYPMIASLTGSRQLVANFLDAFAGAHRLANRFNYLFPIYYQVGTLQAEGAGSNYAVGGLYAWSAILAARLTGDARYRAEARRAIRVLYTVPSDRLFHEPQELAFGALAAAELGMRDEALYLLSEELRMFYWFSDPSQKTHSIRGMVQAAASILYPAFKENVEAILPWTGILRRGFAPEGILRFMDQQRRNNFSFFESCTGSSRPDASGFIPFENLGTLELNGQTGNVGKEIYGAGECLWMYLLFEGLGRVADRELMLVNLNLLEVEHRKAFPPRKLDFLLFNPGPAGRTAEITLPFAQGRPFRLLADGKEIGATIHVPGGASIRLACES